MPLRFHHSQAHERFVGTARIEPYLSSAAYFLVFQIRARAIERGGELLEAEKREKGGRPSEKTNASGRSSLQTAIKQANLTPAEARTMINVARVPPEFRSAMSSI
jgi:hypothetical protein